MSNNQEPATPAITPVQTQARRGAEGASIVVCCHNSARLLPQTLACLAAQRFAGAQPPIEVIVVDNASIDQTDQVATASWPDDCPIPLRTVREPTLGLTSARLRGIAEAKYEFICFVDDDNRINPDWIETVFHVLTEHPEVGVCGGRVEPQPETVLPEWFDRFQSHYAVGKQGEAAGDITESRGYLWGAGLCLRKKAWTTLADNHFEFLLSDRKGKSLSSGGDAELCYALRLTGWRLWYEPRLILRHFLPDARLQWGYLRSLSRAFGAATVGFDAYDMALRKPPVRILEKLRATWTWQTLATVRHLLRRPLKALRTSTNAMEGDAEALEVENLWGRLLELLRHRQSYVTNLKRMRTSMSDKFSVTQTNSGSTPSSDNLEVHRIR